VREAITSMDFARELNSHTYLFLRSIEEPGEGMLRLLVEAGVRSADAKDIEIAGSVISGVHRISADDSTAVYEVTFAGYIVYAVRNESYASRDEQEVWQGKSFRVYSKSRFLDFVGSATFASAEYPGPFAHYGLGCQDHILDIASTAQPEVRRLR
jgi:hypothetical protein